MIHETAAIGLIIFVAALIQGVAGFAFALVSMALLTRILGLQAAVGLVSVFGLLTSSTQVLQLRAHIDPAKIKPPLLGMLVGTPIGLAFLRSAPPGSLEISLGVMLVLYSIYALSGFHQPSKPASDRCGVLAGLAGGILGGAFTTAGPPLVVYTTAKQWDKYAIKSSLAVLFTLGSILQVTLFSLSGLITWPLLKLNLMLAPVVLAGIWGGTLIYDRINHERFQQLVLLLLLALGLSYLVR